MTDLRRLLAEATPRPWNADGLTLRPGTVWDEHGADLARAWLPADAALIVAAVNALPALLDVADAARTISDPMVADGGGDRWWAAHDALRDALRRLDGVA